MMTMLRCFNCNREIPEQAAFCPYCGAQKAAAPVDPGKPANNRVKIVLIGAIAAVVVTAIVLTGIILINNNKKKPTFGFDYKQYTAQVNALAGETLLDEHRWTTDGTDTVYQGGTFAVDLDIDADSSLVTQIDIAPATDAAAQRVANATAKLLSVTNITTIDNRFVFTPEASPNPSPNLTPVPPTTVAPTTAAPTAPATTAPATTAPATTAPATAAPTTKAAKPATKPTEPPTAKPVPTTAATSPPATESNFEIYRNTEYGWSVAVPKEWFRYGTILERDGDDQKGAVSFIYKAAYDSIHAGHVFTIYVMPAGSQYDDGQTGGAPAGGYLGRNANYAFYWWRATDVQIDYKGSDSERQSAEYKILSDMRQTILDSFTLE